MGFTDPSNVKSQAGLRLGDRPEFKRGLKEASKNIPKYLFRMWSPASGGNPKLNTTKKVIPHMFYHSKGHATVYDLTRSEFISNTSNHLRAFRTGDSEFSSWTASLQFALEYATTSRQTAYVAMIDTEQLAGTNSIFHVPSLGPALDAKFHYESYHWEYLAHGIIEGQAYKAVSFQALCDRNLIRYLSHLDQHRHAWLRAGKIPTTVVQLKVGEVQLLKRIADLYGDKLSIPFAIALITIKRRSPDLWANVTPKEVSMVLQVLGEASIPDWCGSRGVICDDVYDPEYEDNLQMVRLMRALHSHCYGRGARGRATVEELGLDFAQLSVSRENSSRASSAHDSVLDGR